MKKNNITNKKEFERVKRVKEQNEENTILSQKKIIKSILDKVNDPNIVKKIFTYVWTITH